MQQAQKRKTAPPRVIGLDIGDTNCRACTWSSKSGTPEPLVDELGNKCVPSVVAVTDVGVVAGHEALASFSRNPKNVFSGITALLKVDPEEKRFKVEINGVETTLSPKDILTHLLVKIKNIVQRHLGKETVTAVVAVPVSMTDTGRQAVKDACNTVGLNTMRVINQPTSVCIAYRLDRKSPDKDIKVLVVDMGGKTLKLSVLLIEDGIYEILHTASHLDVSGNRFDERLADFLLNEYDKKNKTTLHNDSRIMRRMCAACCKAKECLSGSSYTNILIENLHNGKDYKTSVRKAKFEELNMELFNQSIKLIDETLKDANVSQEDINVVVMAGGSTKIPKLSEMLSKKFQEQVLPGTIDPEDIVSYGCVMQANILAGHTQSEQLTDLLLLDVEPLSLGLETAENVMAVMVPRNATIPCKKTLAFTTYHDNQVTMVFRLFEGERCFTADNNDLGMFEMTGIWPEPRGRARIDVTFEIDSNGVLTVTAVNRFSRKSQSCSITDFKSFYDHNELEDIIESATSSKEGDEKKLTTVKSKLELVSFITNMEAAMEDGKDIHGDVKQTVLNKCGEVKDWIASKESIEQNMFEEKLSLIQNDVSSLVNLNIDVINHCRNEKLHFISGRVQNKVPRKSKGLSKGWGTGRGGTSSTFGGTSTRPAPAADFTIDEVD